MHPAVLLSMLALSVNLSTALAQFAISRAPGWRAARMFGFIALSAACYSVGNLVFVMDGLPASAYLAAARWNYFWAALHVVAWYPYAFGGADGRWGVMPARIRAVALAGLVLAATLAVTGWHLRSEVADIPVRWANLTYHYATTTPLGDAYGLASLLMLGVPFARFVRRWRRGEPHFGMVVAGFTLFVLSAAVELAVANGWLVTFSPAELGFLAVVAPTSISTLRRFIDDAHRLHDLSGRLAGEVRDRTEERDRAESALAESERLAALGRLAAGVGHEINNPLTYLQLALDRVGDHLAAAGAPEDVRLSLGHARDGAWRIEKVVEGLRTFSKRQGDRRPLAPAEVARAAMQVAHPHLRHVARVESELGTTARVMGDEPRLVQALVNLLANAAQAVGGRGAGGRIVLRTFAAAGGEVVFEVEDDGPGIAAETLAHLTEPYFTTRAPEGGLGLGLFLTRGIVDAHGGRLVFDSGVGRGTTVRLVLPPFAEPATGALAAPADGLAAPAPVADGAPAVAAGREPGARPRILLVDDEPLVLSFLVHALGRRWDVAGVGSAAEALARLERERYDAIVCDLMMPGTSGMELAGIVAERDPALRERMLFLTGGAVTPEAERFVARPGVTCVGKPVDLAALHALLEARVGTVSN